MKKLTIAITTFEQRFTTVQSLVKNIRASCDNDILLIINSNNEEPLNEEYRKNILTLALDIKNCYTVFLPEFKSLAKMWNTAVIFSRTDHVLLLNDDLVYKNNDAINILENIIQSHDCFTINGSFSHFVIEKQLLHKIGYFDERLCAYGEEDGDFVYRYIDMFGHDILNANITGIANLQEFDKGAVNCETHIHNKPRFNREFALLKYVKSDTGIRGMAPHPCKKVIEDYQQYPYEMFIRKNKHNIKTYSKITNEL